MVSVVMDFEEDRVIKSSERYIRRNVQYFSLMFFNATICLLIKKSVLLLLLVYEDLLID